MQSASMFFKSGAHRSKWPSLVLARQILVIAFCDNQVHWVICAFVALHIKILQLLWQLAETFKPEARRLGRPSLAHKPASFGLKAQGLCMFKAEAKGLLAGSL